MGHPTTYYDLLDAFALDGCPACRVSLKGVDRYFDSLTYECVNDRKVRDEVRASHGLCREHAYHWIEQPRVLSTAMIYRDVYGHLRERLRALEYEEPEGMWERLVALVGRRKPRRGLLQAEKPCAACLVLAREDEKTLGTLLGALDDPGYEEAYAASAGLCLPHLKAALAAAPHQSAFQALVEIELKRQDLLVSQLDELIRREDPRYRGEPSGPERGAAHRAVRHAADAPWGQLHGGHQRVREEWLPVTRVSTRQRTRG